MAYKVVLQFECIEAENPLGAAKEILKWIESGAHRMTYDVIDEETDEAFTVDLSEDDEDAVLPNNSK